MSSPPDVYRAAADEAAVARHGVREAHGPGEGAGEGGRHPTDQHHI